jgi:hypothetical protein
MEAMKIVPYGPWVESPEVRAALAEYDKVRAAALAEYKKVCDAALAEYVKVCAKLWTEIPAELSAAVWKEAHP